MTELPRLTLVTGGISSGKSRWAENFVSTTERHKVYIATAQAFDLEMDAKIARHRVDRGDLWRTVEAPLDLAEALTDPWRDEVILVDCLTMWMTNHLMAKNDPANVTESLIKVLDRIAVPVILVTNEVGWGGISPNAMARRFAQEQGRLNQRIAQRADLVVAVLSGQPMVLKGTLPVFVS